MLRTQRGGYKGAKFFSLLPVCFSSLSLDEEKLGATALVHRVSHLMIFMGDGQLGDQVPSMRVLDNDEQDSPLLVLHLQGVARQTF